MNAGWSASLDNFWHSASLPMWLALAAALFFGVIVLVTLLRAEKSVANGALTIITLLAIGVAAAAALRASGTADKSAASAWPGVRQVSAALPSLACLDELAGDMVLAGCEKVVFGGPDSIAAAVSQAAGSLDRLRSYGNVAAAAKTMPPELASLRRAVERDRYGLVAYVLQSRDRCMPDSCAAYASFTDHKQIADNMEQRLYEGLVTRYAPLWNAPQASPSAGASAASAAASVAGLPPSVPTGKPTTAEFPSAASIPPISIMTDTPAPAPKPANANAQAPRPARKQAASKDAGREASRPQPAAPVQLEPAPAQADN